jgi:uncharacterized protein YjcR
VRGSVKTTSQLLAVGRSYNPKGGAPRGNRNALKTGQHTGRKRELRSQLAAFIRNARAVAAMVEAQVKARGEGGFQP